MPPTAEQLARERIDALLPERLHGPLPRRPGRPAAGVRTIQAALEAFQALAEELGNVPALESA